MSRKHSMYLVTLSAWLLASSPIAAQAAAGGCTVQITEPRPNQGVATHLNVKGAATLPFGNHLWVFVRPVFNFRTLDLWWPQGQDAIDSGLNEWELPATFGGPGKNLGEQFDVTAAVFAEAQHAQLVAYLKKSMEIQLFQPITMPAAACVGSTVTVRKETD